jgi:hypothetical protein
LATCSPNWKTTCRSSGLPDKGSLVRSYLATLAAYVALLPLLWSGITHAGSLRRFRGIIQRQAVWPRRHAFVAALWTTSAELGLAAFGLLVLVVGAHDILAPTLLLAALMYLGLALYIALVLKHSPGAPCGCSTGEEPANVYVLWRGLGLLSVSLLATLDAAYVQQPWPMTAEACLPLIGGLAITVITWALPSAMHDPYRSSSKASVRT